MFPSKILLFGEYTILLGSYALAIPYSRFNGDWDFANDSSNSNSELKRFLDYAKSLPECPLDTNKFEEDLAKGIYFKSNIPQGAGVGSSGALVAAIFKRYSKINVEQDITEQKNNLALLESFYHGSSSGIDPLVSYLNSPVLVKGKEVERVDIPEKTIREFGLFLVYSGQSGKTSNFVEHFKNKCNTNTEYLKLLQENYIPLNNECVKAVVNSSNSDIFFNLIEKISHLQLSVFDKMIPSEFVSHIKYGLDKKLFYMKLCGSGGGGFFLSFSKNLEKTKDYFDRNGYKIFIY